VCGCPRLSWKYCATGHVPDKSEALAADEKAHSRDYVAARSSAGSCEAPCRKSVQRLPDDIGVRHPEVALPGSFSGSSAIGASYHSFFKSRPGSRPVTQEVLEVGWRFHRHLVRKILASTTPRSQIRAAS